MNFRIISYKEIISYFEAFYIVYMLNYFKTKIAFDHGLILNFLNKIGINHKFIEHHTTIQLEEPINMVCPLGHFISWLVGLFIILRNYIPKLKEYNITVFILLFIGSFMNVNVLIYLLPIFIIEFYLHFCF